MLFSIYQAVDRKFFSRGQLDAFTLVEIKGLQLASEFKEISLSGSPDGPFAPADQLQVVKDSRPDVILNFSEFLESSALAAYAEYGCWSIRHGAAQAGNPGTALFWEIYRGEPVSQTHLQALRSDNEPPRVIYRSFGSTCSYSLFRTRNQTYWKASAIVIRCLQDLQRHRWHHLISRSVGGDNESTVENNGTGTPTNLDMAVFIPRVLRRMRREHRERRRCDAQWLIGFRRREHSDDPLRTARWTDVSLILPPRDKLYADPFVVRHDGANFIFFEECGFGAAKGIISYIELDAAGGYSPAGTALERDYHLSYPMMFQWQGSWYMIPETKENRTIEIYRAVRFPGDWKLEKVLFDDVLAVDTTVLQYAGKWWLFTNMSDAGASIMDELFLFSSESPLGEWKPHTRNPIVSDVRKARPAGSLFCVGDTLMRPSQDNSVRYGHAINLNRVDTLSEDDYRETTITRIEPTWHTRIHATHTFNFNDDIEVIDGMQLLKKGSHLHFFGD